MMARGDPLPQQYPPHPSGRERFSAVPAKYRNIGAGRSGQAVHLEVSIQGANVLYEHFMAAAAILDQTAPEMMNVVGDIGVEEARSLVPYDTGATHDSITIVGGSSHFSGSEFGFRVAGETQYFVEVGPETFYAPFLEYGTVHMGPRPFMFPALDLMEATLAASVAAILTVVTSDNQGGDVMGSAGPLGGRVFSDPRVRNPFSGLRTFLYSSSKALGDLSVIGGRGLFGPLRSEMLSLARLLGDVGSIMNQTVSTRISNRLQGRVTGRIIGFGSASLSFGKTYSAFPGGAGGHRIYQRVVGAHTRGLGLGSGSNFISRFMP